MANKINFSDYKASGVYFIERDNSIITTSGSQTASRVAVGFNMKGPFNRPVYVANTDDGNKFFGTIDRKLERNGCFTNRMMRTMLRKSPIYVLNLLPVESTDEVGCILLPINSGMSYEPSSAPYMDMYDRTKFWVAADDAFVNNQFVRLSQEENSDVNDISESAFFGLSNCGTKDISIIIKKSDIVAGYNVTFLDYYGSEEEIPYKWINPNDYVSDYFVDVYAISGQWDPAILSNDVVWSAYFDKDGLKSSELNKFLRLDTVNVIGSWSGSVIPNFMDKQGNIKSIDYVINAKSNETGLMFGVNEKAMDAVSLYKGESEFKFFFDDAGNGVYDEDGGSKESIYKPDIVGHCIKDLTPMTYMSYNITEETLKEMLIDCDIIPDETIADNEFIVDTNTANNISVGDYVRAKNGMLAKIIKKRGYIGEDTNSYFKFTANDIIGKVEVDNSSYSESFGEDFNGTFYSIKIQKSLGTGVKNLKMFNLKGLKIGTKLMPGYDSDGNRNYEAGVEKIYKMLTDPGIRKGLLNDDSIDFRYLIDTMGYGLKENCGGKKYLSALAKEKQHCTAIINAPSMSQFAASDAPFFGKDNTKPAFDVSYIPLGGNPDLVYDANTEMFSLPNEDWGSDHAGVFAPFMKYSERGRVVLVPPAADVSNTFMNKFTGGDPYATVANLKGIIANGEISGVEYQFDDVDRGSLEKMGINPIIERNGQTLIYGDKTAYQLFDSDLSYLHVRELLNTIQIACKEVLDDYVFTHNIPTVRAEIVSRINPILKAMKDSGALVRYEIQCDNINNDKEVIDNKFCIVEIGVWVSQNMEKIVVPITLNRSTTA